GDGGRRQVGLAIAAEGGVGIDHQRAGLAGAIEGAAHSARAHRALRAGLAAAAAVGRVRREVGLAPAVGVGVAIAESHLAAAHASLGIGAQRHGVGGRHAHLAAGAAIDRIGPERRLAPVGVLLVAVAIAHVAGGDRAPAHLAHG